MVFNQEQENTCLAAVNFLCNVSLGPYSQKPWLSISWRDC